MLLTGAGTPRTVYLFPWGGNDVSWLGAEVTIHTKDQILCSLEASHCSTMKSFWEIPIFDATWVIFPRWCSGGSLQTAHL